MWYNTKHIDFLTEEVTFLVYNNRTLRHELKYFISPYYYEILRARLSSVAAPDKNALDDGEYRVTSLYFENIYRSVYNDKMLGSNLRRKYRIRIYNLSPSRITLEAKYKDDSYVSKTNAALSFDEYKSLIAGDVSFYHENAEKWKNSSLEDFIISNALVRPRPSVIVDYFREAYIVSGTDVRITFDKHLSTCFNTTDMLDTNAVFSPVTDGGIILEIKFGAFLPAYISELFAGFPLTNESVSKFVLCTDKLSEVKKQCVF